MAEEQYWWQRPFRVFQTNLREIDAGLDERQVVATIAGLGANAWLLNVGGIVSFYPSKLPFQQPSPWLGSRASGDLVGDALTEAHRHEISVIARLDFSKVNADIAEANRDWCFAGADGQPQMYNGLFSTCPSGPYYQEKSFEIIREILDRYDVDGFFFNWFNFSQRDYSGNDRGICQCYNCKQRFTDQTGMRLPTAQDWSDPAYLAWTEFTRHTLRDLAGRIRAFISERRPEVPLMLRQSPDVIMHEANNAIDRPQPLWVTAAGDMARHSRTDYPGKPVWVNTVTFIDLPYRFTAEQPGFIGLDLVQTFAQGANPSSYIIGTPDLADQRILDSTARLFTYHRDHAAFYDGLTSAAKVAVVASPRTAELYGGAEQDRKVRDEYRGVYRALVESHIPFDVLSDSLLAEAAADGRLGRYDALVLPNVAVLDEAQVDVLDRYVAAGGGLLATYDSGVFDETGQEVPEFRLQSLGAASIRFRRAGLGAMRSSYLALTQPADVPGANANTMLAVEDAFLYVQARPGATESMTYRSPAPYGPPEKCYGGVDTGYPGQLTYRYGQGRTAYLPWPAGAMYYRLGLADYRQLLATALDKVLRGGRQIRVSAPPQVEVCVGTQPGTGRTLIHLINYTGYQGRAFYDPIELRDIRVEIRLPTTVTRAVAAVAGHELEMSRDGGTTSVVVPRLGLFELVVFD
jgi:Hypothetical glycosyl hydrolase 6/Beta-galactosidase trimerisation domain